MQNQGRRNFLRTAAISGIAAFSLSDIVKAGMPASEMQKKIAISGKETILFQGDSITDAGRNKESNDYNNARALGTGYATLAAAELLYRKADADLKIYNKGISGNKVFQLAERWEADTLALKPDVLSILIGVNDYWHSKRDYDGTIKKYRDDFKALLQLTKQKLPNVRLIIGEPFALAGIKAVDDSWYPDFDEYRVAAKEIAGQFDAIFIPYQSIFDKAVKSAPGIYWTHDGVHPSLAGAQLMAAAWLEAIK